MQSKHEVPYLTAAVLGIHKARSLELNTDQEKTLSHVLELLCELASGVQFSLVLLKKIEGGPEEEFVPQTLSEIVLGVIRATEILNEDLNPEEILHLSSICYQVLLLNKELKPSNSTYVSYCAEDMVYETFPVEVAVV